MRHPYTRALMGSIPRLDAPSHVRLEAIPGRPPLVLDPPPGCRFAPRCPNAQERCRVETPPLVASDDPSHQFACFNPVTSPVASTIPLVTEA
jgi:peptide/nickel transport system ATP-binding protein